MTVDERGEGQRLDNYVLRECPSIPKTRLYRAMRKGEIRVNKGRVKPDRRLSVGDSIRLPPLSSIEKAPPATAPPGWQARIARAVVHEDDQLLVINKPSGIAVHGGSGLQYGLIETLRTMRPELRFLELVHRLDRETSGLILIAKRPAALRSLHAMLRKQGEVNKQYLALCYGKWPSHQRLVEAPLARFERKSGERIVRVTRDGKPSSTAFSIRSHYAGCSLVEATPLTGRTHQIRVHAQYAGHAILGDAKYGDEPGESLARALTLKRLFLHAEKLAFTLDGRDYAIHAPLDDELQAVLTRAHRLSKK